jgi:ribonuclease G
MKVLPGMQSAFVDIGLERDAFLYVDDFADLFDEEEGMDFKESAEAAPQPQREEKRRDRREREDGKAAQRQERTKPEPIDAAILEDAVEQLAEIADERIIIPPPEPETESVLPESPAAEEMIAESPAVAFTDIPAEIPAETFPPVERITDDDVVHDRPAPPPPRGRHAKVAATAPVYTPILEEAPPVELAPMERITDEPVAAPVTAEETGKRSSRSRGKKPQAKAPEPEKPMPRAKKQEAQEAEQPAAAPEAKQGAAKKSSRKKPAAEAAPPAEAQSQRKAESSEPKATASKASQSRPRSRNEKRSASPANAATERPVEAASEGAPAIEFERIIEDAPQPVEGAPEISPFRHISEIIPGDLLAGLHHAIPGDAEAQAAAETPEEDREARVGESGGRAEFAMRRGGRNRRRDKRRDGKPERQPVEGEEGAEADATPAAAKATEVVEEKAEAVAAPSRPEPSRKPEAQRRPEARRSGPPTITELLREGQEVLVQIAKEPIAKKGARITSHIALPGRFLVYMPSVNHVGVSRKIPSDAERVRLKRVVSALRDREGGQGGFIARTACAGVSEQDLHDDLRYLLRTWNDIKKKADRAKPPSMVHRDLDLIQRILRDQVTDDYSAIRVDNELEYARIVEFVNRVQPRLVNRVKLYTGNQPILEKYNVQPEIDKAVKPRVWLKSGGYIVINQTEALVAIDVNTGKFVGKSDKLEDTITRTNMEAAKEIVRQIRLRDLGGIIVVDFIDMEERKNRQRVMLALQEELSRDRSPSKLIPVNDFGLVAITRKRVKQSLERTLCSPCPYCQGSALVKSAQTMCYEILEQAKAVGSQVTDGSEIMLRVSPIVAEALHTTERQVFEEIEAYFDSPVSIEADPNLHQEQYDFAVM